MLFEGVWDKINVYSNVEMFDKIFWVSVMEVKVLQEVSGSVLFLYLLITSTLEKNKMTKCCTHRREI